MCRPHEHVAGGDGVVHGRQRVLFRRHGNLVVGIPASVTRHLHSTEFVEVACQVRRVTDRAVLLYDGAREAWVPKSQIETPDEELEQALMGETVDVLMAEWVAREKGFL